METCRPASRVTIAAVIVAVLCTLLGTVLQLNPLGSAAAAAVTQPDASAATKVEMTVESLTGALVANGEVQLRIRVRNAGNMPVSDLRLIATLHRPTRSRLDYQRAITAGELGSAVSAWETAVPVLPARGTRVLDVTRTSAQLGFARPADRFGVYPLRLELLQGSDTVDTVRTSIVLTEARATGPLRLALIVPLDAAPALRADGTYDLRALRALLGPGGRITQLVAALRDSSVALTVATSGLLLEQLADVADGFPIGEADVPPLPASHPTARAAAAVLADLRAVVARPNVTQIALPFGPSDLVALTRQGRGAQAAQQISEGLRVAERVTGQRPAPGILWPPDGLDAATLDQAFAAGTDTVILNEGQISLDEDRDLRFSPSPVRRLRTGTATTVTALVPDPFLDGALQRPPRRLAASDTRPASNAIAAQRILGESAALYYERPNTAEARGLLLAPPQVWTPTRGLLDALLQGMQSAPWLRPVEVAGLVNSVTKAPDSVELDYPAAARRRELPTRYLDLVTSAREDVGLYSEVVTADVDTPAGLDRLLRQATSVHYRGARMADGRALVDRVDTAIGELFRSVTVAQGTPVTLTGVEGQIPVTLTNLSRRPLDVAVTLDTALFSFSESGDAPNTRTITLAPETTLTIAFTAEALRPGATGPVRVIVADPQGEVVLASGTLVVRSTAYSVAALALTVGAAIFLFVWWVRDARRQRERRRAQAAAGRTEAA